jgi:hypothetical protein
MAKQPADQKGKLGRRRTTTIVDPDPDVWKAALAELTTEMSRREDWTWTHGGCFAFASAFQAAFGGELFGVCRRQTWNDGHGEESDYPVDHALVSYNGKLYDFDGVFDPSAIGEDQVIKAKSDPDVSWFEDDFFDDEGWKRLHEIMARCARGEVDPVVTDAKPGP